MKRATIEYLANRSSVGGNLSFMVEKPLLRPIFVKGCVIQWELMANNNSAIAAIAIKKKDNSSSLVNFRN